MRRRETASFSPHLLARSASSSSPSSFPTLRVSTSASRSVRPRSSFFAHPTSFRLCRSMRNGTDLDLSSLPAGYWRCIRQGKPELYHGVAVHPRHLSWYERVVLKRNRYYDPEQDRIDRLEECVLFFRLPLLPFTSLARRRAPRFRRSPTSPLNSDPPAKPSLTLTLLTQAPRPLRSPPHRPRRPERRRGPRALLHHRGR